MKLGPSPRRTRRWGRPSAPSAPRRRSTSASTDTAERAHVADHGRAPVGAGQAGGRVQAQHVGVAAGRARRRGWSGSRPRRRRTRGRPISTGANSHGTVHEACTASATLAARRPRAAEHDPAAGPRSTAATRRRPSNRAPECSTCRRSCASVSRGRGRPAQQRRAHQRAAGRGCPSASGANVELAPIASAPARRAASSAADRQARATGGSPPRARAPLPTADGRRGARRRRPGARRRSSPPRSRRSARSRAGRSRWRPRCRPAPPSSMPRRARRRRRARARRVG